MTILQAYNIELNKDDLSRFHLWENYRNEITDYLIRNMPLNKSILILGSGNSDDIDLSRIKSVASRLTLADIDTEALNSSLDKYLLKKDEANIITVDFTGLTNTALLEELHTSLVLAKSKSDIDVIFDQYENYLSNYRFQIESNQRYGIIIISPLYTQLILPVFLEIYYSLKNVNYPSNTLLYIFDKMMEVTALVIDNFNQSLINILDENGHVYQLSDIFETTFKDTFYHTLGKDIRNTIKMDSHLEEYTRKFGPGAGDYGCENLKEYLKEVSHQWFIWPFTESRRMFVKATIFIK